MFNDQLTIKRNYTMLKDVLNLKNTREINKDDQKTVNGGLIPVRGGCNGAVSFSPDGTCPPGQRLIGHCICCDD